MTMKFSEDHEYEVVLHHRDLGQLGEATLTFGGEKPVVAEVRRSSPGSGLGTGRSLDFVRADTEDGRSFTLWQCTVHGFAVYATYLAYGDMTESRFSRIDIRYSDISEWFLNRQRIQGNVGEQLNWSKPAEHFSVQVTDADLTFNLSSRYVGTRKKIGEDHVLNEHVKFCFESLRGELELETVSGRVIELGLLLSLLISYPISVVSVEVWTGQDRIHSVYFGSFKEIERDTNRNFSHQCFIQKHALDGRWSKILQAFYEDPDRRKFWCRLAGMLRYEGFWEFKFLGYAPTLTEPDPLLLAGTDPRRAQ
jgi:ApeA N-terminal domain 1